MNGIRRRKRRKPNARMIALGGAAAALCAALVLWLCLGESQPKQARGVATQEIGLLRRMTHEGQTYVEKPEVTTILLMGVDRTTDENRYYGARQGGQTDFLVLMAIDHGTQQIHQLHIDRDTMIGVDTLSVLGKPQGLKTMQICLSHAFGADEESCALNTQAAVERLLAGLETDYYIAMNLDIVGVFNEMLGGIEVTLEEDFSYLDPAMTMGATLRLSNEQAYNLVKRRMDVGEGTNEARMKRQQWFMRAFFSQLQQKLSSDSSLINTLFDSLSPHMATNMSKGRMAAEAIQSYHYDALPAQSLAGEHTIGADGFVEFHVNEGETSRWVKDTLFKPDAY